MVKELSYKRCTVTIKDSTEYLGNNCVVVSDNDSIEQVTHYYPFGAVYADAGLSPGFQKYKYTGKELDLTHRLNTYDHGARQNYSILGVWDRIDPMYEKYYNVSPYVVCGDNPTLYLDLEGLFIHPSDSIAYNDILNTLPIDDRKYVVLDGNGNIDYSVMASHETDSENYKKLLEMSRSRIGFYVNVQSDYTFRDNKNKIHNDGHFNNIIVDNDFIDSDFSSVSGNTTGETGLLGKSLLPGTGKSGFNSIDDDVHIFINPRLSIIGQAETLSHELYGHSYVFFFTKDRSSSMHDFDKGGRDNNGFLKFHILRARKETIKHLK